MTHNSESPKCIHCAYWISSVDSNQRNMSGSCHFWPPVDSTEVRRLIQVETENLRIRSLKVEIDSATRYRENLKQLNSEAFKSGKTFDQIKEIQVEMAAAETRLSGLQKELSEEPPLKEEDVVVIYRRGVWPVTASDDWCGQWKPN